MVLSHPTPRRWRHSDSFQPTPPEAGPSVLRFGLTEVYAPPPSTVAQVDIVLIHGLNGEPKRTWTSKETDVFWPRDLLPEYLQEQKARVLVYGYDADVAALGGSGVSKDKIHNHAERLVADLFANRRIRKATERPIIFVAHSLGGLILKRALIWSSEISGTKIEHLRSIYVSTYGILFLGTPHRGSDLGKWGKYLSWLCQSVLPSKLASSESQLIEALQTNSETLVTIDRQFAQLMDEFHIFFFHEAKPTNLKGTLRYIVEEESAAPLLPDVERAGIQADHSHMCKFDNASAPGFDLVVDGLQRYSDQAPGIIRNRWVMEKQTRLTRAVRKVKENYSLTIQDATVDGSVQPQSPNDSTTDLTSRKSTPIVSESGEAQSARPPRSSEPFFIVPPGFRANTVFVGMEHELQELDQMLFDDCRRDGTACVLLHGQPGSGKTHVARQYVYKNRSRFKGGVFWINAHLMDEVFKDYWQIHQKAVAPTLPEYAHDSPANLGRNFVDDVREWFSDRQEWLIVLDGISIENDGDIDALQQFIPDSPNCGIIYVSRSRRLENIQRLLRPQAIKITGLSREDAQTLLFKEMSIRRPTESQLKAAKTLVKRVGGLPLAISAIARRLSDTHEPIEKFNLKSYSEDLNLGLTYQRIMKDLQKNGHREAINLMNILCFLGSHIPVEMIHLGLQALHEEQVRVRAREHGRHADLNITLGILMRYALIERNEPNDTESLSSSFDGTIEPEPIDVLNVHAVVQRYWCDSIHTAKQLPLWLGRTIRLLVTSFHEADLRISQQEQPGRISDYRWYLVHARRLRLHCVEYESRHQRLGDLKAEIDSAIGRIEAEIKTREPGSSQDSLDQPEFQISIFDRTSGTSSSGHSQTSFEDPTPSPGVARVEEPFGYLKMAEIPMRPGLVAPFVQRGLDIQYPIAYAYPVEEDISDSATQQSTSISPSAHPSLNRQSQYPRVHPHRSDSFRSTSAIPIIYPGHAVGLVSMAQPSTQQGELSNTSSAVTALTQLHSLSLIPPRTMPASEIGPLEPVDNARSVSSRIGSPVRPSSNTRIHSRSRSRRDQRRYSTPRQRSPQSNVTSPTITQGMMGSSGLVSPVSMSRDGSDQDPNLVPTGEPPIFMQPAVVLDPSMAIEGLRLVDAGLPPSRSPSRPASLKDATPEYLKRFTTATASQPNDMNAFEVVLPTVASGTYAPRSDPLPAAPLLPAPNAAPSFRRESVPLIPVDGLGVKNDITSGVSSGALANTPLRPRFELQRCAALQSSIHSPERGVRTVLGDRDPNLSMGNPKLNRGILEDRKASRQMIYENIASSEFGPQAVSFAPPGRVEPPFHPYHQRANTGVEPYDQVLLQVPAIQRQGQQGIQYPVALVSSPSLASLNSAAAQSNEAVRTFLPTTSTTQKDKSGVRDGPVVSSPYLAPSYQAYATSSRISVPVGPIGAVADPSASRAVLLSAQTPRRRTLSAPESPGPHSGQRQLWGS